MFFSDYFSVDRAAIDEYGAFDISLSSDLPLFIDPFLLFNSEREDYQNLHEGMIRYLRFLRDATVSRRLTKPLIDTWFRFPEVHQTWLGFTISGNRGSGLGAKFASSLAANLHHVFHDFGSERVTAGSHLEKLCLIRAGVGRDNISDFTTNLIKGYLLQFTEEFAKDRLDVAQLREFSVPKVEFNYDTMSWKSRVFTLPCFQNDYVILTPRDMLTRDDTWISRADMLGRFESIAEALPNPQLRELLSNYLLSVLPENPSDKKRHEAIAKAISRYPEFIDHYIRYKEESGEEAEAVSEAHVTFTRKELVDNVDALACIVLEDPQFSRTGITSHAEAMYHVKYLKQVIEHNDGYRLLYVDGEPIRTEHDLQLMFRLTWARTEFDVNSEVNNGRGPVDFKISQGLADKSLVEFKLARNRKLRQNLMNQVQIYQQANQTTTAIKVIVYFTEHELAKVTEILVDLGIDRSPDIVLIDARNDNKPSASVA